MTAKQYTVSQKTITVLLHHLVKLANNNCCRCQWRIACETPEFTLQNMRPP